jgi:hypothetical protein
MISICGGVQSPVIGGLAGVVVAVIVPPIEIKALVKRLKQNGSSCPGLRLEAIIPKARLPTTSRHEIKVPLPEKNGPNPELKPELNAVPEELKEAICKEAGRHCHNSGVEGSGIKFCNEDIAPGNVAVASRTSESPLGLQGRGFELRCIIESARP